MLADLGLLYCALFWGVSFVTMKILVGVYPACWLLFLRFSTGAAMIYLFFHKRINKFIMHELKGGIVLGIMLFIAIAAQTIGLNYIGGGRSAFISATYVLMVPLMLWAVNRLFPGWVKIFAAALCVAGMYLLTGDEDSGASITGDFLTVICALMFAVQVIAISRYTQNSEPITLSFVEFVSFSVMACVSSLMFEHDNIRYVWVLRHADMCAEIRRAITRNNNHEPRVSIWPRKQHNISWRDSNFQCRCGMCINLCLSINL